MYLSLDIETQNLQINTEIHYIGVYTINSFNKELFVYFKLPKDLEKFRTFITNRLDNGDKLIWQHGKFDTARILYSYGIDLPIHHDTIYLGYLFSTVKELKEHQFDKWLSLKAMAQRYLGVEDWDVDLKTKTSKNDEDLIPYLTDDCKYCYLLFMYFKERLSKKKYMTYKLIIKLANCYKYIEYNGVPIDMDKLFVTLNKFNDANLDINNKLKDIADINYNSSVQLQDLLYNKLGLPILKYTDKGQPSTDKNTLKELQDKHPIIGLLLEHKLNEKAIAFLNDWKTRSIIHDDGLYYIHPTFNLHSTVTGRTSSEKPNFQQIPRNKELKALFNYTKDDYVFVCADFSQAELRFASIIANVKNMKESYRNGEDLHTKIASIVNKIDPKDVTKPQRTAAKAVNFGFLYGMQAESFVEYAKTSYSVTITSEDAKSFRDHYFELYPELKDYYQDVDEELWYYGELTSIMQRNYTIDLADYHNKYKHEEIRRAAINFPVQSAASDYVLCALYGVMTHPLLKHNIKVCGTVHDSIIMLVRNDENLLTYIKTIKDTMQYPPLAKRYLTKEVDIPIVVDIEIGPFGKGVDYTEYFKLKD